MKKSHVLIIALFAFFGQISIAHAAETMTTKKTSGGVETREVSRSVNGHAEIPKLGGLAFYYGGMADDGVRRFNSDGTGTYIDGENKGSFEWGYATPKGWHTIKTLQEWNDSNFENSPQPGALIYINFTSGSKSGESYAEVVAFVKGSSGTVYLSPYFFTK